jgi:hypothetical protein
LDGGYKYTCLFYTNTQGTGRYSIGESGVFAFGGGVWPGSVGGSPTVVVGGNLVD